MCFKKEIKWYIRCMAQALLMQWKKQKIKKWNIAIMSSGFQTET